MFNGFMYVEQGINNVWRHNIQCKCMHTARKFIAEHQRDVRAFSIVLAVISSID